MGLFRISQKERIFFVSYNNQVLLGVISRCAPLCNLQKRSSFSLQFGQEENILGYFFETIAYWFVLKAARVFSITTDRENSGKRMVNTSLMLILPPYFTDSLDNKSKLFTHFYLMQNKNQETRVCIPSKQRIF